MKAWIFAASALLVTACSVPQNEALTSPELESETPAIAESPVEMSAPDADAETPVTLEVPAEVTEFYPPPGSNEMLRSPLSGAEGLEVIISDVVIPPEATVPRHYHPGEEFVYVIEGSAVHVEEGQPDRVVQAGEALVIPPGVAHAPRGGPEGARAIVFRVHVEGAEERTLVDE
jgi:quercetin dioxygenase-like cupin family protein